MKNPPADDHIHRRFAPTALMLGNVVTGCSVLAPAGMLIELSSGLDVSIRDASLLVTFGAVMLCIGSPVTAWLTSRIERRTLLAATLAILALGNAASAFAPSYASLLAIRLVMLAIGALFVSSMLSRSVVERRLEFATLKAIGIPSLTILLVVAAEAVLVSFVASLIGIGVSLFFGALLNATVAVQYGFESIYSADVVSFMIVFLLALALGVIAGLAPARRATRVDPVDILREA